MFVWWLLPFCKARQIIKLFPRPAEYTELYISIFRKRRSIFYLKEWDSDKRNGGP